jgi:hypothetical protein
MSEQLVDEIARKVNDKVNIPLLSERTEQALFRSIIKAVLDVFDELVFAKLNK